MKTRFNKIFSIGIVFTFCCFFNVMPLKSQTVSTLSETLSVSKEEMRRNNIISNTHYIYVGNDSIRKDSVTMMLNRFYVDQFRHFQDPRAPYFMFMSKSGNIALGVGGQVKIKGYFDWNGSIPSSGFSPYLIPIPKNPAEIRNLSATPSGTGIFFTLLGSNKILGDFMAYFQADFSGYNNRGFRVKKAYVTFRDWTAGYTVSTFEDTKAEPSTVDGAGPNGINSRKNILVRYMKNVKKNWVFAGSVEFPSQSITTDGKNTESCNPYIPDFAGFVQYQWNKGNSHLRLSGLLRTLSYRDLIAKQNYNITGWGLQLSSVISIVPDFNFFGIVSAGQGHASYTTDLGNGNFDLIPDENHPGKLYAPKAMGIVGGLQYYFTPSLFSNIAFSEQTYYPKNNPNDSQYKYGIYAVGNLFWDVTPRMELGIEYLYGRRKNFNGMAESADRIMAMFMVSF